MYYYTIQYYVAVSSALDMSFNWPAKFCEDTK